MKAAWDHLAVAAWNHDDVAREVGERLGGREIARFKEGSWSGLQLAFAGGIRLEVLEPIEAPKDDFLVRFLEHTGPGPHHVTFKVDDIEAAIAAMAPLGLEPVKVDLSDPNWKECFLHPRSGVGTVVQLAQPGGQWTALREPAPSPPGAPTAEFVGIVVRADPDSAERVFGSLLGGRRHELGSGRVAYSWDGDGTIQVEPAGDEKPRVDVLVFRVPEDVIPGEKHLMGGVTRVAWLTPGDPWPS